MTDTYTIVTGPVVQAQVGFVTDGTVGGGGGGISDGAYVTIDDLGNAVIHFRRYNDPQVLGYELREGNTTWDNATLVDSTVNGDSFSIPVLSAAGKTYWVKGKYSTGYTALFYKVPFTSDALIAPTELTWRISEPDIVFSWTPVVGASQYVVLWEDGGVSVVSVVNTPEAWFSIPKWASRIRVMAVGSDGRLSKFTDEEVSVTGRYNYNEIVNISLPITTGQYINMAFTAANQVKRLGLLGATIGAPYVQNINDADLYTFGYNLANLAVSNIVNVSASWFRNGFWKEREGYFESGVLDFGSNLSGRLALNITKTVTYVGDVAVSGYAHVSSEYLSEFQVQEITDTKAFVTARFLVCPQGSNDWKEVGNGDWVNAVRYCKIVVDVAMASPLTDITVTAGYMTLDVPDVTESGTKTGVTSAGAAVTFSKTFNSVKVVLATARGSANAYTGSITTSGFTAYVDTGTQTVDWFAKGY